MAAAAALALATSVDAATFTVNSSADVHDASPGDGVCETAAGNHVCTLRAAIEEANQLAGPDTINLQANVTYLLSLTASLNGSHADLIITDSLTVNGGGPASTIIDGNGAATGQRVLYITQCVRDDYDSHTGSCLQGKVAASMSGLTIEHGRATGDSFGGGILNAGTLVLDRCVVTDNRVDYLNDWGGGIMSFGSLTLTNSIVSNNATGSHNPYGGGIYNQGDFVLVNTTVSGNTTPGPGGGLVLTAPGASINISRSTFSGNTALRGGGIYKAAVTAALINDTISGNFSTGAGGGVYNYSGTLGLYNVTVAGNRANANNSGLEVGGGVVNNVGATLTAIDSIIAGNQVGINVPTPILDFDECEGTITSQGYNIVEFVNSSYCTVTGPYGSGDPALGPLQLNGGATPTHAIGPGSAALDAGNPTGCTDDLGAPVTTDQRGVARPAGPACDIGAFEYADAIFKNGFDP